MKHLPHDHSYAHPCKQQRHPRPLTGILSGILTLALAALGFQLAVPPSATAAPFHHPSHILRDPDVDTAPNCTLIIPNNPLTAQGLATPYQLKGMHKEEVCHEDNPLQAAFVEAAIIDPLTGAIAMYHPLVIDAGTRPAISPILPSLPQQAIVAIWFGFNGTVLHLTGAEQGEDQRALASGHCVNGLDGSDFGQYAYCNAPAFFHAANAAIAGHKLTIPPLGKAKDGLQCPTTRDFAVVDQDPSDNVAASYLITSSGQLAQNSAANQQTLANQGKAMTKLTNGSDEGLLAAHLDPVLGCTPWEAPDLTNNRAPVPALALNELQAAADQETPVALVPQQDEMVLVNGHPSVAKQNLYRAGVDQPNEPSLSHAKADQKTFCQNIKRIFPKRLALDAPYLQAAPAPVPGVATLYDFLKTRYAFTYSSAGLNCKGILD